VAADGATIFFAGGGTGGHLYPGLAIARTLGRIAPQVRAVFVGARRGIERTILPEQSVPFALLDLHPLYRPAVWRNWRTLRGAVGAWRELGALVAREKPRLVVGTGGYASGLTLAYAIRHGVPIVQQIADSHPGLTARWFTRFCREAYLGYPEAAALLPHGAATALLDTGNPIEPPPVPRPDAIRARVRWEFPSDVAMVLLVFGGSQGARALNEAVSAWIAHRPEGVGVIWATGQATYEVYARHEGPYVRVRPYLAPIAEAYAAADVAVTRAGAMTTAELCAWGIPMVLVPLPTAAADHQSENARALARAGAAIHLPQATLSPARIGQTVASLIAEPERRARLAAAARDRARPAAAETIARRILSLLDLR